jgi:hypothetical protein
LRVEVNGEFVGLNGLKLNIDGQVMSLEPVQRLTSFDGELYFKSSMRTFFASPDLLGKMVAARSVKLRIQTSEGIIDARLIGGKKVTEAYLALKELVEAIPAQDKAQ